MSAKLEAAAPEPICDELEVMTRAHIDRAGADTKERKPRKVPPSPMGASKWSLTFDCETTTDPSQRLRFGSYQVREGTRLHEIGVFYSPWLAEAELDLLRHVAEKQHWKCRALYDFVDNVFFRIGHDLNGAIIGFNLPFDISRLASSWEPARQYLMRGGFTFKLAGNDTSRPNVQVKVLGPSAAKIQFGGTRKRQDNRREREIEKDAPVKRGTFIDDKTLASALVGPGHSLDSLTRALKTVTRKAKTTEHGSTLSEAYILYAMQDVQATWECSAALLARYGQLKLSRTQVSEIYSEASIGKAYLRELGIKPWRMVQPNFPAVELGRIWGSYFGGRAEVHLRREIRQIVYADFLSMYPTVCVGQNLWRFVIAKGIRAEDATEGTRELLQSITVADLQNPRIWKKLNVIVQVMPSGDVFPVRARYQKDQQATIGLNKLHSGKPMSYTLADCIASKLLTGRVPQVVSATRYVALGIQDDLQPLEIDGELFDPRRDNFHRRAIDRRTELKDQAKLATGTEREGLEEAQLNQKLLANSTAYGIFAEINVEDAEDDERLVCHGANGERFEIERGKVERAGNYQNPVLAAWITGAARLMLAIAEACVLEAGLNWAFCDTDSMAICKPDDMPEAEFYKRAQDICDWFLPLNPYAKKGPLFKIEDVNYVPGTRDFRPLYCWAISAKRYALFNLDDAGKPIIRQGSAHGLGHLLAPYEGSVVLGSSDPAREVLKASKLAGWQYDLWFQIIRAALEGHPDRVDLDYHPNLKAPAVSRYAATTPHLLKFFHAHNAVREPQDKVRPFNFMIGLQPNRFKFAIDFPEQVTFGNSRKSNLLDDWKFSAIAPFTRDPWEAAKTCFDRNSGLQIPKEYLRTYSEVLTSYHLRPEGKFENGKPYDRGFTRRRNVRVLRIRHIGKEANRLEEQSFLGYDQTAAIDYGLGEDGLAELHQDFCTLLAHFGQRQTAEHLVIARHVVARLRKEGFEQLTPKVLAKIRAGIGRLESERIRRELRDRSLRQMVSARIAEIGLTASANELGVDLSNLRKFANGQRGISEEQKLEILRRYEDRLPKDFDT